MNCSTCRFASENPRTEQDVRGLRAIDLTQPKTYGCRRYPPTFAITAQGSAPMWPNMLGEHWCGEHRLHEAALPAVAIKPGPSNFMMPEHA